MHLRKGFWDGLQTEGTHIRESSWKSASKQEIAALIKLHFGIHLITLEMSSYPEVLIMGSICLLTFEWGLPTRSFLGLEREPGNEVVGLQLRGGGGGREGYKIQFKVFRYFAPCWSRHGLKILVFSSFRSTLAPVFGQSSLEIVGWPKSLSFFFIKDCLML